MNPTLDAVVLLPPNIETDRVAAAVSEQFGLSGQYKQLVSERDQNFRLQTTDGRRFVVKVTGIAEDPVVTDFQIKALVHLQESGAKGLPQIVRRRDGEDRGVICDDKGERLCLRIVTYLDGDLLIGAEMSTNIAHGFGGQLATLNLALENFSHPGDSQELLWDMQRALELRELLVHFDDAVVRERVEDVFDVFEERVTPRLNALPRQVIHNDANGDNVLLNAAGEVSGIIDFGDMLRAPRIVEIAIAASYLRSTDGDLLQFIEPFVLGYHETSPLLEEELEVLYDLICTRLATTISILYWRLSARELGDPYREKTMAGEASAFGFLEGLRALGRDEVTRRLSNATHGA